MHTQNTVKLGKIELWYETFGDPARPAILLIMGANTQSIAWSTDFCTALAKNYYVIRYDHRDTGLSSTIDFISNPYDINDLADDAINLLTALKIQQAHLVGTSMGGFIAQLIAVKQQKIALSATLIATTYDLAAIIKDRSIYKKSTTGTAPRT